ncbi:MAG: hypothetical protein WD872_03555 [Pirellulaceae bacterium]
MPFDPSYVHPDEPPLDARGDLALTDDLATLAEQLSDDAAHLARCYPAGTAGSCKIPGRVNPAKPLPRRAGLAIAGVGLSCLGLVAASISFALLGGESAPPPANATNAQVTNGDAISDSAKVAIPATPSPVMLSVGELSGPEREALFDLLDDQPQRLTRVSF